MTFSVAQIASFQKHKNADVRHFRDVRLSRNVNYMLSMYILLYITENQY